MNNLKILHVTPTYFPAVRYGGPIVSVHMLCKYLAKLGHEIHVYTTSADGEKNSDVQHNEPIDMDGVKVWYFRPSVLRRVFYSKDMKDRAIRDLKTFDLMHAHTIFVWPISYMCLLAANIGVPYILSTRGMLEKSLFRKKSYFLKTLWLKIFGNKILRSASLIHATSDREKKEIERFSGLSGKVFVVPNGIESATQDESSERIDENMNHFMESLSDPVIYVGRLSWKKRITELIRAVALLPGVDLVIAGNDDENMLPEIKKEIRKYEGLYLRCHIIGFADQTQKNSLFKYAKALVLPSYSENFGIIVLEALSEGCPVIVTSEVGVADFIQKNSIGLITAGDAKDISEKIKLIIDDVQLCSDIRARAPELVKEHFGWDAITKEMLKVYTEVCH